MISVIHSDALRLHRAGRLVEAEGRYREALADCKSAPTAVCLAQLLLLNAGGNTALRLVEARDLVRFALTEVARLAARPASIILSRCGYFYLLESGALRVAGSSLGHAGTAANPESLRASTAALEQAVMLDPEAILAWQNLAKAYRAAERLDDAARASSRAVDASRATGKPVPVALLYELAKALRRVKRFADAATVLCDALDADPSHELAAFCLRVTQATCAGSSSLKLSPAVSDRIAKHLSGRATRGESGTHAPSPVIPHDYVRLLFDGYASKFESHLTEQLAYRTPSALLALALAEATKGTTAGPEVAAVTSLPVQWVRCADLGCGTGLMGALVRPHVRELCGVDLSPAMIAECERTRPGVYDVLGVGDVEEWLRGRQHAPQGSPVFDLVICADVLVYIPELRPLFSAISDAMSPRPLARGCVPAVVAGDPDVLPKGLPLEAPPPLASGPGAFEVVSGTASGTGSALFLCSTEADLESSAPADSDSLPLAVAGPGLALPVPAEDHGPAVAQAATSHDSRSTTATGYRLLPSGRCCHSRSYVVSAAVDAGFSLAFVERRPIRKNAGADIIGDLFVFRKN